MEDTIFTQIIKGEIPCHKVYEDATTFAFMDIHPIRTGHVLVVPKQQIDNLWDLPAADYQALMTAVHAIAQRIQAVLQPERVGMHVAGLEVAHAHVHLFPFNTVDEFWERPDFSAKPNHDALASVAKKLAL